MTANGKTEEQSTRGTVGRRGLIAGAAALAAAVIAKQATNPVAAADGGNVMIGNAAGTNTNNLYTTTTTLSGSPGLGANPGFRVTNNVGNAGAPPAPGTAPTPDVSRDAIQGYASQVNMPAPANASNAGVLGRNDDLNGIGVAGVASNGTGIYGQSTSGTAVGASSSTGSAVYATSTSSTGVVGSGPIGVNGNSAAVGGYGGYFTTTASSSTAVGGQIFGNTSGAAAFVGAAGAGNYAAFFTGTVVINGALAISGGGKSAAVKHPLTNDYRLLYCVESPESWFEDYGEGKVVAGKADVKLDPNFTALVDTSTMHVFVTEIGGNSGLHTTSKSKTGFTVEADPDLATAKGKKAADLSGTFSWRVVGKRTDVQLQRFAKFDMPNIKLADKPPAAPVLPRRKP